MDFSSVNDMIKKDLEQTGANADEMSRVVEERYTRWRPNGHQ